MANENHWAALLGYAMAKSVPFLFCLGHSSRSNLSDQYYLFRKRPHAIAVMNTEWPPFNIGRHNSEGVFTTDSDITPLTNPIYFKLFLSL